jgi:uncharacterized protein (DUF58 family)
MLDAPRASAAWTGPGARAARRWRFRWSALLWQLVFPRGGDRVRPTVSGLLLISLSLAIGTAAYNTANNILFITLSLLLACLILSGVVSWLNFHGVSWRVQFVPPLRAGQETAVVLDLRNAKTFLPTYGLWFDLVTSPVPREPVPGSLPPPERRVREIIAALDRGRMRSRLFLRGRLDPRGEARIDWGFKPAQRGALRLALESVGSLFPFGFLQKHLVSASWREVIVWPASVEYRSWGAALSRPQSAGTHVARAGSGGDLLALRRYEAGDSHRLIHWKASARMRQLLVRQFSAESQMTLALWLQTPAETWTHPEQFELLVSFAATLAEDLFRTGKLASVALNGAPPRPVRRVRELEVFLDELAVIQPTVEVERLDPKALSGAPIQANALGTTRSTSSAGRGKNVLTFAPEGTRGVAAYVDGEKTAAT